MEDDNQSSPSLLKKPTKYKFLRRVLNLTDSCDDSELKLLNYTKMRRIYFRKIDEQYAFENGKRHYYSNSKQLNCLTGFNILLCRESHDKKFVKLMNNLKHISISLTDASSITPSIDFIKQIPKNIETVVTSLTSEEVTIAEIKSLYRNLGTFRKLRKLEKFRDIKDKKQKEDTKLTEIEYNSINNYIPKLRNFKQLYCIETLTGIQKYMSQNRMCPYVTGLEMKSQNMRVKDNNAVPPLFSFHLFPRLQQLKIATGMGRVSFSSLVSEGFKTLLELKHFTLVLSYKQEQGRHFLFEGLSHLPLLDLFCLSMHHIENDEELLLVEFLQKQTQLVSLALTLRGRIESRQRYREQNQHLERICQSLNDKIRLQYLNLDATVWSLHTLSRGLSQVTINQLRELRIGVFDDISITSSTPTSKVEGLCEFIERQKQSLSGLKIEIGCVKDDEVVDRLIRAIGETNKLWSLSFTVNSPYTFPTLENNTILEDIPSESLEQCPSFKKTFASLNQLLPQLKELSYLHLGLNPLACPYNVPVINSSAILNSLSAIKNLENFSLRLPFMEQSIKAHPAQLLLLEKIKALKHCSISSSDNGVEKIEEVRQILEKTKQQRYFRANLTL